MIRMLIVLAVGCLLANMPVLSADKPVEASASYRDWKHSGSMWLLTTP